MATLSDVAARAGVSVSAVSRVLSRHPSARVSEATRERIFVAARELQYRPNFAARALKSSRTRVIGLVLPDLTNALFTELMDGAEDEARAQGYTVLLGRADSDRPGGEVIGQLIGEGRVDGMVVQLDDDVTPDDFGGLVAVGAPVVLLNATCPGRLGSVALDDHEGALIAAEHLLALGHVRIAMANGLPQSFTARRRLEGVRDALVAHGVSLAPHDETRLGYTADDGREALRVLMALPEPPTGVVVANVNAAVGLLAEARSMAIRVPDDLAVVCVHDSWTAQNTWPPLSAVAMPFYAMGRSAAASVIRRIEGGPMSDDVITDPPPKLMVRESTGPPRSRRW